MIKEQWPHSHLSGVSRSERNVDTQFGEATRWSSEAFQQKNNKYFAYQWVNVYRVAQFLQYLQLPEEKRHREESIYHFLKEINESRHQQHLDDSLFYGP